MRWCLRAGIGTPAVPRATTSWGVASVGAGELPPGWVVTASGRISGVADTGRTRVNYPFPDRELIRLDTALTDASRRSKARFAVYIGDLGGDAPARAREILAAVQTADNAVLLAVSPDQRAIEVVYGRDVRGRGIESAGPHGVVAAAAAFRAGNLVEGLVSALRVMSAGTARP